MDLDFDGQGVAKVIPANSTKNIDYIILNKCQFNGLEILNGNYGDFALLQVIDDANGSYSGTPNTVLNQFGTSWFLSSRSDLKKELQYFSTLYPNMILRVVYTNSNNSEITAYVNYNIHKIL